MKQWEWVEVECMHYHYHEDGEMRGCAQVTLDLDTESMTAVTSLSASKGIPEPALDELRAAIRIALTRIGARLLWQGPVEPVGLDPERN